MRLTKIFRQAAQSGIVVNAHRINAGQLPSLGGFGDFFWFGCEDTEQTAELVTDIVARRIPARFGLDPRRDVQVLCPMHRGPAGAGNLNMLLQEALTPFREGAPERRYGGRVFRVGDKVTQLRNNYDKGTAGVFNGTVGVVTAMSPEDHTLTVRTDEDEEVDYGFDELDELAHAYAVTIHRSQGSEYPAVVIPLTTSSWMMLQRNLLYTGVTRARRLVVLAGSAAPWPPPCGPRAPDAATPPSPTACGDASQVYHLTARLLCHGDSPVSMSSEEKPMTTATISPWPLVRQGDQEHPVKTLQYLLRARGHDLTVDGIFGPATDAAVRAFQQQKGLAVDGIVGPGHLVGADHHGPAGQPGRRRPRGAGGVPVPQPVRRPGHGPAGRRDLRARHRRRRPRLPAGPSARHRVGHRRRHRRRRHLAGPGQRNALLLIGSPASPVNGTADSRPSAGRR